MWAKGRKIEAYEKDYRSVKVNKCVLKPIKWERHGVLEKRDSKRCDKYLECRLSYSCLSKAAYKNWDGFTSDCAGFVQMSKAEKRELLRTFALYTSMVK